MMVYVAVYMHDRSPYRASWGRGEYELPPPPSIHAPIVFLTEEELLYRTVHGGCQSEAWVRTHVIFLNAARLSANHVTNVLDNQKI
jgi:hypothetical protein